MFYHYEILPYKGEDILYLYLTMKYEFSKDLLSNSKEDLERRCKNFILSNHIPYKGNKIYLVVDGVVVKSLNLQDTQENHYTIYPYYADSFMITLSFPDYSECEISLREYLLSILFSYYDTSLSFEVLKAICILYNTYCFKMMNEYHKIKEETDFAYYRHLSYYKMKYSNYQDIKNSLNKIIEEVDGIFLQYGREYILPFIHYSNKGKTLLNPKYPYLSSVKSMWDILSNTYLHYQDYSKEELEKRLKITITNPIRIEIKGNVYQRKIVINHTVFTPEEVKSLLDIQSLDYYFLVYSDYVRIISFGKGNGYGLSIYGSNEMAKNGLKYYHILRYYFPKVGIYRNIKGLS